MPWNRMCGSGKPSTLKLYDNGNISPEAVGFGLYGPGTGAINATNITLTSFISGAYKAKAAITSGSIDLSKYNKIVVEFGGVTPSGCWFNIAYTDASTYTFNEDSGDARPTNSTSIRNFNIGTTAVEADISTITGTHKLSFGWSNISDGNSKSCVIKSITLYK